MIEAFPSAVPEIDFSAATLLGYFLTGLVFLLLPLAACFVMYRLRALRVFPVIAGAVTYFLAVQMNNLTVNIMFSPATVAVRSVIAVVTVGIFEETGRYLAMRFPVSDVNCSAAAFCYGIGHGGLECIIRAVQTFRIFHYGTQCSSAGVSYYTDGHSAERAEEIVKTLQRYADRSLPLSLMHMLNAAGNFGFHIALSLLIYRRMQEGRAKSGVIIAILLHYGLNELYNSAAVFVGDWAAVTAGLLCTGGIMLLVMRKLIDGRGIIAEIQDMQYPAIE